MDRTIRPSLEVICFFIVMGFLRFLGMFIDKQAVSIWRDAPIRNWESMTKHRETFSFEPKISAKVQE